MRSLPFRPPDAPFAGAGVGSCFRRDDPGGRVGAGAVLFSLIIIKYLTNCNTKVPKICRRDTFFSCRVRWKDSAAGRKMRPAGGGSDSLRRNVLPAGGLRLRKRRKPRPFGRGFRRKKGRGKSVTRKDTQTFAAEEMSLLTAQAAWAPLHPRLRDGSSHGTGNVRQAPSRRRGSDRGTAQGCCGGRWR